MARKKAATPKGLETPTPPKINEVVNIPIDKLTVGEYPNPNVMNEQDLGRLTRMIRDNGFDEPLQVVQKNGKFVIVGGHHRFAACKLLGFVEIPSVVYPWDDHKAMEELVRRNLVRGRMNHEKFGELLGEYMQGGEFDWQKLTEAFACREQDVFKAVKSNDALREIAESMKSPDSLPEAEPKVHISQKGDVWQLGQHRIVVGDATKTEDLDKLMGDDRAALLVTDPPYGVEYTGKVRPKSQSQNKKKEYTSGKDWSKDSAEQKGEGSHEDFLKEVFRNVNRVLLPRTAWYCWHAHTQRAAVVNALLTVGVKVHQEIIWVKPSPVLNYSFFPQQHEPAAYGYKEGEEPQTKPEEVVHYLEAHDMSVFGWRKGEKPPHRIDKSKWLTTVWQADFDGKSHIRKSVHPSQKPVALWEIPPLHHLNENDILLDPFLGSGTALIAAERVGRRCFGMDVNPFFVDLAIRRWQDYSKQQAVNLTRKDVTIPPPKK